MTLYMGLAQEFESQMKEGLITPGSRLPSVRTLSQSRKLSVSTVLQAYMTLEARGLIEARPQSGYYACAPLAASVETMRMPEKWLEFGEVKTNDIVTSMRNASRDLEVFQLGCVALMDPKIYPLKKLSRLLSQVAKKNPESIVRMDYPPGNLRLRKQIARRYSENGVRVKPEHVVITSGCNEAISLALRAATKPGDTVLVESPTYFGLLEMLEKAGLKVVEVPQCAQNGIDIEGVRNAFRKYPIKAGFVIPNFSNPTGSLMTDEKKEALVRIFEKNDAWLIEDDIFSELSFSQTRPKPLRYFDTKQKVITCSSFTKTLGPGLRVGWILPGGLQTDIENFKYLLNGGTPLILSELIADFLDSGSYDRYLRKVRQTVAVHVARVSESVLRSFPEGTQISKPEGGYVLWVKLPKGYDGVSLYRKAMKAKINFAPGILFSASGKYENYIRISCGTWSDAIGKAICRLGGLLK
jgi:DNA-binding transcriptional MocR family regulator